MPEGPPRAAESGAGGTGGEAATTARYVHVAWAAAVLVLALGVLVLMAWAFDIETVKRIRAGYVAMTPLTAIGFVLAGTGLLLVLEPAPSAPRLWAGRAFGAAVVLLGAVTIVQYATRVDLGLDRLLFPEILTADRASPPGRPAPNTAAGFVLAGIALILLTVRVPRRYVSVHLAALAAALFALQQFAGYAFDVEAFYTVGRYTPMALHTSLGLTVIAVGILFARPDRGLMVTLTADDIGGYVARRLLPAAVLVPLALGLVRIVGEQVGIFNVVYGLTLVIVLTMAAFTTLVWWNAAVLHRVDERRTLAEAERRRALVAAEADRAYLAAVLDQLPSGVIIADAETGRLVLGNRQVEEIFGHPFRRAESIEGYDAYTGHHADGRPYEPEEWPLARAILKGETVEGEEIEIRRGDGSRGTIRSNAAPVRNAGGTPLGGVVTFYDVTEEKHAREVLRESEARLRRAIAFAPLPVIIHAEDGDILEISRAWTEITGYSPEEIPSIADWTERAYGERGSIARDEIDRLYTLDHAVDQGEWRVRTRSGEERIWAFRSAPLGSLPDRRRFVISMAVDLTERTRAERERARLVEREQSARAEAERRAREEAALRRAAEVVTDTYTTDEVIRRIAEMALEATGADGAFVLRVQSNAYEVRVTAASGTHIPPIGEKFAYEDSATAIVLEHDESQTFADAGTAEGPVPDELRVHCPGCSVTVVPLKDSGEPIGSLVLVRGPGRPPYHPDEVERAGTFAHLAALAFRKIHLLEDAERKREELQQLLESRGRLMRGFSHDLKNPLGAVDGRLALLEEGTLDGLSPKQREGVSRARGSIRTALGLIDSLVELARVEAGRLSVDEAPTELRGIAHEVAEEYRAAAEAKGLSMRVALPDNLPVIRSDVDRIRQILANLLVNAVRYTETGGITVRPEECEGNGAPGPGRWVCLQVSDTGPGIPEDKREEIFGEFTRLEPGEGRGAGLGLAISRRLAHLLGGEITLESEVGAGSTFTLWLPRSGSRAMREAPGPPTPFGDQDERVEGSTQRPARDQGDNGGARRPRAADGADVSDASDASTAGTAPGGHADDVCWADLLLDHLKDYAVFLVDRAGRIIRWNRGAERVTGRSADQVLGRRFSILYGGDEVERGVVDQELRVALTTGRYEEERWRFTADGTPFFASEVLIPIRDRAGHHFGFGKIFHDLTERKRAEAALEDSERLFRSMFEQAAVGMAQATPDGRWLRVNRRYAAFLGYSPEELEGTTFRDVTHPEDVGADEEAFHRILAGEIETHSREKRYVRKDGAVVWGVLSVSLVRDDDGEPRYFVAVVEDVTGRKRAEAEHERAREELASHRVLFDAVMDQLPVGVSIAEVPSGRGLYHNEEAERLLGHSLVVGEDYRRYGEYGAVHEDGTPYSPEEYPTVRALLRGERIRDEEMRYHRMDGTERHFSVGSTPVVDADGRRIAAVSIFLDISRRKRAEEALREARDAAEQASQAKSDFLAVMSHELRTPLTAVIGYTEMLERGLEGPVTEGQRRRLERIRSSAYHLVGIIEEILTYSRMESGRDETRLEEQVDLTDVVREAAELVEPVAREKGLGFRLDLPREAIHAETDPGKVRRIILNVLTNAVSFTREGEVDLRMNATEDHVTFRVRDTGIGISPAHLERIFEPFWQVDDVLTREVGGTGLGLTVARRLARMLGGDITVESAERGGSTFTVRLPRHATGSLP